MYYGFLAMLIWLVLGCQITGDSSDSGTAASDSPEITITYGEGLNSSALTKHDSELETETLSCSQVQDIESSQDNAPLSIGVNTSLSSQLSSPLSSSFDFFFIDTTKRIQESSSSEVLSSSEFIPSDTFIKPYSLALQKHIALGYRVKRTAIYNVGTMDTADVIDSTFNEFGQLILRETFEYDTLSRFLQRDGTTRYTYDENGLRINDSLWSGAYNTGNTRTYNEYSYDLYDRLIEKRSFGYDMQWGGSRVIRADAYIFPDQIFDNNDLVYPVGGSFSILDEQPYYHYYDSLGRIGTTYKTVYQMGEHYLNTQNFYQGSSARIDSLILYDPHTGEPQYINEYRYRSDGQLESEEMRTYSHCKFQYDAAGLLTTYLCRSIESNEPNALREYSYY